MPEETKDQTQKLQKVNLSDVNLPDEDLLLDPTEDAFTFAPPPPDAEYKMKLTMGRDGPQSGKDRDGTYTYVIPIEARITDGEQKDAVLFYNASTRILRGKKICSMAGILTEMGFKVELQTKALTLARTLQKALAKEPIMNCTTQWRAYDIADGPNGRVVATGMEHFPQEEGGAYIPEIKNQRTGITVPARAKIIRFRGKASASGGKAVATPKAAKVAKPTMPALEEEVLSMDE